MNLSRLKEANLGFERLKQLDAEIMAIEKLANEVANKRTEINLELTSVDLDAKEKGKVRLNEYGDLIQDDEQPKQSSGITFYWSGSTPATPIKKVDVTYKEIISDVFALQVLGLLISQKQAQRVEILKVFEKWGIRV